MPVPFAARIGDERSVRAHGDAVIGSSGTKGSGAQLHHAVLYAQQPRIRIPLVTGIGERPDVLCQGEQVGQSFSMFTGDGPLQLFAPSDGVGGREGRGLPATDRVERESVDPDRTVGFGSPVVTVEQQPASSTMGEASQSRLSVKDDVAEPCG